MIIYINDHPENFPSHPQSLSELLSAAKQEQGRGMAIAVNGNIVSRTAWKNFAVKENDRITLIRATQGG